MFGLGSRQLFFILLLVCAIFVAFQYAPAYINWFEYNDFIRQEVKYAATSRKSPDALRREIAMKAPEYDIPVTLNDVHVTRRGPSFTLQVDYEWPIDLRIYKHNLKFHISEGGEVFEDK
jgi:hypothetical protein